MIKNDELVISTVQGKKGAYLKRRGITYNVLNSVDRRPSWFTLHRGDNQFEYEIENGIENAELTIYSQKLYEGM